jgi:hypothetical protein
MENAEEGRVVMKDGRTPKYVTIINCVGAAASSSTSTARASAA